MRRKYWQLARKSVDEFFEDSPFQLAAALSFYTVLSLSPLVLIVVAAAGLVWGEQPVRSELLNQIRELTGDAGAETVRTVLESTTISGQSIGSMILGIITSDTGTVRRQVLLACGRSWSAARATDSS